MADTKISELPVASVISSPDVAPVVRAGVTMQADVSLFGSILSRNITRVDASGGDSTGAIGNLSKPFLTVQAAINSIQALIPIPAWPVIDIGNNHFTEDVTTSLSTIAFTGNRPNTFQTGGSDNTPFNSLTFDASVTIQSLLLKDCVTRNASISGNSTGGFTVHLVHTIAGTITNTASTPTMSIYGYGNSFADSIQDTSGGGNITLHELALAPDGQMFGQTDTTWTVYNCPTEIVLGPSNGTLNLYNTPFPENLIQDNVLINVVSPTFLPLHNTGSTGNGTALALLSKNGVPDVGLAGFEKGSICMDTANGKLYVNGGDAATPDWRLVVSV